jgi:hypothetical protein
MNPSSLVYDTIQSKQFRIQPRSTNKRYSEIALCLISQAANVLSPANKGTRQTFDITSYRWPVDYTESRFQNLVVQSRRKPQAKIKTHPLTYFPQLDPEISPCLS